MTSRLLASIEARIAQTRDPLQTACLRAERATLLARQGHLEEARSELKSIRAHFDSRPNAVVSAWVCLGEGLVILYSDFGGAAQDKIQRSFALSSAVGDRSVRFLSAAWLAHLNYLDQDFASMVRHLQLVLTESPEDAGVTRARGCLVTAQAYHWANRFDLAQPWYKKAQLHATACGDETMLSALMHNMAWLRAAHARRLSVSTPADHESARSVLLGAESIDSFDKRVGTASLRSFVPMLRAHVLTLLGRYSEALELFCPHFDAALSEGLARIQCGVLAEMAWCHLNIGESDQALDRAEDALSRLPECKQPDERAPTLGRLAQIYSLLGEPSSASRYRSQAEVEWQLHAERQSSLLDAMSKSSAFS